MRELKFRVWDKKKKIYTLDNLNILYLSHAFGDLSDEITSGNFIIEQYTGCKDKKGKDIYEGDIVSYENEYGLHIMDVTFNNGSFCVGLCNEFGVYQTLYSYAGLLEIIGNINPE